MNSNKKLTLKDYQIIYIYTYALKCVTGNRI